jgi:diketogulonate reductase-like aldo/keto reductase
MAMSSVSASVAPHGVTIPRIGFGTWPLTGTECEVAVLAALRAGYRHIDTAAMYGNETAVGRALQASGIPRSDLWVTTKVWTADIGPGDLQKSAEKSLQALGLQSVDLLLIHWPNARIPVSDCIGALCDAKRRGLTHHIGVSNFPTPMMRAAQQITTEPILTNQIELHPHLDQSKVLACARELGWSVTAYSPLGRGSVGGVMGEPTVIDIARRKGKTAAQIVLRWHLQHPDVIVVPKSATPARMAENIAVYDFELDADEMARISGLARPDGRIVNLSHAPQWD